MPATLDRQREADQTTEIRWGGTLVAGFVAGTAIFVGTLVLLTPLLAVLGAMPDSVRPWLAVVVLGAVGLVAGIVLGWWRGRPGTAAAIVAGVTTSILLLGGRMLFADGPSFNPHFYGWSGMLAVLLLAPLGARLGAGVSDRFASPSVWLDRPAGIAIMMAAIWLTAELLFRLLGAVVLGGWLGNVVAGDMLAILFGMPTAAYLIARYGRHHGISPASWEYRWTTLAIAVGLVAGLVVFGLIFVTAQIDSALFGLTSAAPPQMQEGPRDGVWVAGLLLLANGIVGPASEELAWRAVIQTALVKSWGVWIGLIVTALLFTLKHVLIDASLARVTTLLMLSLVFGIARQVWGSGSSTVAHWTTNLAATAATIAAAT